MKKITTLTLLAAVFVVLPLFTNAETVVRTGESVSIASGQVVEQDFYTYGGTVTHSGEVTGDMYAVTGSATINGPIGADLTILGGSVQIHSSIGDDLRVVGGETVLAGEVEGDVFVIGGLLKVLSSATVNGNVYFYGGELETEGVIEGSLLGYADKFLINGAVNNGVDVTGVVELGDRAGVKEGITYSSVREIKRAQNADVEGDINKVTTSSTETEKSDWWVTPMIIWSFTTLGSYLFLRKNLEVLVRRMRKNAAKSGLVGLVVIALAPVLSFILMATVLGLWFGVLSFLAWTALLIIAWILLPMFVGYYIYKIFKRERSLDLLVVVTGLVVCAVLMMIPRPGGLLLFIGVIMVVGHLCLSLYKVMKEII